MASNNKTLPAIIAQAQNENNSQMAAQALLDSIGSNTGLQLNTSGGQWNKIQISVPGAITQTLTAIKGPLKQFSTFITTVVVPIMNIVEMFINTFSSFAKAINALIQMMRDTLQDFSKSMGQVGIYANVYVPPALMPDALANFNVMALSTGGFQGFLSRFQASLVDPTDKRRPNFGSGDIVGGIVLVVDSDNISQFFSSLKALNQMIDLKKLFEFNLAPPPPINLSGRPGYFKDKDGKVRFGIEVSWEATPLQASFYKVYRSQQSGGSGTLPVKMEPEGIVGPKGVLTLMQLAQANNWIWPTELKKTYKDVEFNGGSPVVVDFPGTSYVDYEMGGTNNPGQPFVPDEKTPLTVYYVITSNFGNAMGAVEGDFSQEIAVEVKWCSDATEAVNITEHSNGMFEIITPGEFKIGKWNSIQAKAMVPWIGDLVDMIDGALKTLQGGTIDASDSFSDFVKQVKEKILYYLGLVETMVQVIDYIQGVLKSQSAALLIVPGVKGGNKAFYNAVAGATVPPDIPPFSGPNGTTAGAVFMYGLGLGGTQGLSPEELQKYKEQIAVIKTLIDTLQGFLKK